MLKVYNLRSNRIGGVMVSVLALIAVDCGFELHGRVKPMTKIAFDASPQSTQQ
jgi:hypothetical protein